MAIEPGNRNQQTHGTSRIDPVDEPAKKKTSWLPWLLGLLALLALLFALSRCQRDEAAPVQQPAETNTADVSGATAPAGTAAAAGATTGNALTDLQNYLGSNEAAGRRFSFDGINFATASAAIPPEASPVITGLTQTLNQHSKARIRVEGYADARGASAANTKLGAARAAEVKKSLVRAGVDASRIETGSGGEQNPIDSNATASGQTANRRTDVVVTNK